MVLATLLATFSIPPGTASARDDAPAPASVSQRIDAEARRILANVKTTDYAHKSNVDESQGLYELDCSGLVDLILKQVSPKHLAELETKHGHKRQLADDYEQTFEETTATPKTGGGWLRIEHLADARPGDILAWKNPAHKPGEHTNTGHVMVIDDTPVEEPAAAQAGRRTYRIRVMDSTASPHGSDTRAAGQSGVGRGTLWLVVDAAGKPIGYRWKIARGPLHEAPIAIGRAVSGD
jgi:hypothetical protein